MTEGEPSLDLSIVIACYNEEGHLEESVRQIERTMATTRFSHELIFIDDCSVDGTRACIDRICESRPEARRVFHDQNVGRGGTVEEGFRMAKGRIVGFLDIDLETHCRYIPSMLDAIDEGCDGAVAYRVYKIRLRPSHLIRHILSRTYRLVVRAMLKVPYRDTETGYKFFTRTSIVPLLDATENKGWFWDTEIMVLAHRAGLKIAELPCLFMQRSDKTSTVRIFRDVKDYLVSLIRFRRRMKREDEGS